MNNMQTESIGSVKVSIKSHVTSYRRKLHCLVVYEIKDRVPNAVSAREAVDILANIPLAGPQFQLPRAVDILICSGTTMTLFLIGQIKLSRDNCVLFMQKTQLGWVVVGGMNGSPSATISCNDVDLNEQLSRFWEVEECTGKAVRNQEHVRCEKHYAKNTKRNSDGRYSQVAVQN